jgi:hypothetical protein
LGSSEDLVALVPKAEEEDDDNDDDDDDDDDDNDDGAKKRGETSARDPVLAGDGGEDGDGADGRPAFSEADLRTLRDLQSDLASDSIRLL